MTADGLNLWEIGKAILLFSITGMLGFAVKLLWGMRDLVLDHEKAIYGRDGVNGLKRGLTAVVERLDLIEDRNLVIDEVERREREAYPGEDRRKGPQRRLRDMIRDELETAARENPRHVRPDDDR